MDRIEDLKNTFDQWADAGRGDRMEAGHWPTAGQLMEQFDLQAGMAFLDVGCGNGYAVNWAAERILPDGLAIGIDVSPKMIELARLKFDRPNARFLCTDAESMPFGENRFDRVLSVESLYYHPNIPASLRHILKVLKPGGWFAAMVDYYKENQYSASWDRLVGVSMAYLSEQEYSKLFEEAGFTHVRTERLFNTTPVDQENFKPGWGFDSVEDVEAFRQKVGSLAIWGQKPE